MTGCPREQAIVAAAAAGRERFDEEMARQLEQCEACADAVAVAVMLRADRDAAQADVQVPSAGQVWWRAAIRARLDDERKLREPRP